MNPRDIERQEKIERLKALLSGKTKVNDLIPESFHVFYEFDKGVFTCTGSIVKEIRNRVFTKQELKEFILAVPNRRAFIICGA